MFIGEYEHAIDEKGRMAVPSKMRRDIGSGAVVTRGIDNCLWLFPKKEWTTLAEKLSNLPLSDANSRAFSRLMLAGAMEVEFDSQGRILLPGYLKAYAGLKKYAVVAGLFNRLEIWDQSTWREYKAKTEKSTDQIAKHMSELGI
ncbi:TPA: transcriptional regulator MraZ [Candidatus Berkelbacteria bacterium]|uniref:Transcriptional regulator MraZ n=1 Tax=Berkelbacteria bacterium GW2011_GWE1_39_12 TaxID=1618337 RepID=A0A0G4B2Y4_9BACT|nr:MAG: protein MraZ protein [Berkelbacteria bacterium GW2011_GWE1_39_12]HBO60512.1 transcriptional regulator MraZ [Candidatus Berkelbacteria bacterium]